VKGSPNAFVIHPRKRPVPKAEMSSEDWDKFEKDIADAFEKVP
jgi:hypothetical protein